MSALSDAIQALGPSLYWPLNETSGTAIADASGNGHTGTWTGSVSFSQPGVERGGVSTKLDGATAVAIADAYAPFAAGSARTFIGFVKKNGQTDIRNIFSGSGSSNTEFPVLEWNGDSTGYRWYGSVADGFPVYTDWIHGPAASSWDWHMFALTVDDAAGSAAAGLRLWVDGQGFGAPNSSPILPAFTWQPYDAAAGRFRMGARPDGAGGNMEFADEWRAHYAIFERLLIHSEIVSVWDAAGRAAVSHGWRVGVMQQGDTAETARGKWAIGDNTLEVVRSNPGRVAVVIVNDHATTVAYLALGNQAVVNQGIRLNPGAQLRIANYTGQVSAVAAASGTLSYSEV